MGVDVIGRGNAGAVLPYGIAWAPNRGLLGPWPQRSVTSVCQIAPRLAAQIRSVPTSETEVGLLLCGEIFHPLLRQALIKHPSLTHVVDGGHQGRGFRVHWGLKELACGGLEAFSCAHVQRAPGRQYWYRPGRVPMSCSVYSDALWSKKGYLWAAGAIFDTSLRRVRG